MTNNLTFEQWFALVDIEVQNICFVSVHELSDFRSRDLFDDGVSPKEAAQEAIADDDLASLFF